ncbi:MAG: magnesium chelatase, partial [Deltaproteobacteria bacterium]
GASPRASLSLMKAVKALALFDGYDFVSPDHIQEIAVPVIAHRLVMDAQAQFSGQTPEKIVEEIIFSIPIPT